MIILFYTLCWLESIGVWSRRKNMPLKGTPPVNYILAGELSTPSQCPIELQMHQWINARMRLKFPCSNNFPKSLPLNTISLGNKASTWAFGGISFPNQKSPTLALKGSCSFQNAKCTSSASKSYQSEKFRVAQKFKSTLSFETQNKLFVVSPVKERKEEKEAGREGTREEGR